MTTILNDIRDSFLPKVDNQNRTQVIANLEFAKLALRISALALAIIAFFHLSIFIGASSYLFVEGSKIASNQQEILENAPTEITTPFSDRIHERQLYEGAPILHSIVRIYRYLDHGDLNR